MFIVATVAEPITPISIQNMSKGNAMKNAVIAAQGH
jgi:hypothetical protein